MRCKIRFSCDTPEEAARVTAAIAGREASEQDRESARRLASLLHPLDTTCLHDAAAYEIDRQRQVIQMCNERHAEDERRIAELQAEVDRLRAGQTLPIPGPTPRDAVAGMLYRLGYMGTATVLLAGACFPGLEAKRMREKPPTDPAKRPAWEACIAALEALAAREAVGDAARPEPVEQPESGAPDREALGRVTHDVYRSTHAPTATLRWDHITDEGRARWSTIGERLYGMGVTAAREEADALRKRVAELEEQRGRFAVIASAVRGVLRPCDGEALADATRRALAEAREQGAAEMRERAAGVVHKVATGDDFTRRVTGLKTLEARIRALPISPEPPREIIGRECVNGVVCDIHAPEPAPWTLTAEAASALLRGGWRQAGELWREPWGGFVDPRTPFGQETLRRALERLRAKAEPTVDRVVLDGPAAARAEAAALVGLDAGGGP